MSDRLENQAEILKLGRLLAVDPEELEFLSAVPASAIRGYRELVTERLFDADADMFRRIGAAAKLLPSGLIAQVAQRAFGPLLCARAVGAIDPGKALDVLKRLPPEFVADATVEVDPRRVAPLIANVPEDIVVPVARLLGQRGEYVAMGRFLAYVPDHLIATAIGALSDEALLRTAFVLEHMDRLDHAVSLLPSARIPGVIGEASALGLWSEALNLLDHLTDARRAPIADVVAGQSPEVVTELVAAVSENGIWDSLLPVVRVMSDASRERLALMPAFHESATLRAIIAAAADSEDGLWRDLAPLINALPPEIVAVAAEIAGELDDEQLERIVREAAPTPEVATPLVALVAPMPAAARERIAALVVQIAASEPLIVQTFVEAAARDDLWSEFVSLLEVVPPDATELLAEVIAQLPRTTGVIIASALRQPGVQELLDQIPANLRAAIEQAAQQGS